ncbi:retrotransposon hot spot protein (RHS) [Trypanosoma rangeli]|uniref:Retrotransposon hot spot protein (RHS) n=1 Tax=Trypanosoma rangeli TaxID=5698 RepID=A0A3R7JUT8_TRYRA|nr:retrotransposon hot spot protein (RHS) [Trypanosoma rangeli]RNE97185.1 retrotransposon hot spot protein (RHS) [Trypanosoma rangeli]|eukprot:RNE97185.1 retrotransposon hot spot protein (RHS) [Trypanosoma rangeli]
MQTRMDDVGPISRCTFNDDNYEDRMRDANNVLAGIDASNIIHYSVIGGVGMRPSNDAPHKLAKVVRVIRQGNVEGFVNLPVCFSIGSKLIGGLLKVDGENDVIFRLLMYRKVLLPEILGRYTLHAFLRRVFVENVMPDLNELPPAGRRRRQRCVQQSNPEKHPSIPVALITLDHDPPMLDAQCGVLYVPESRTFPLVDAFFFVGAPRRTMVAVQVRRRGLSMAPESAR